MSLIKSISGIRGTIGGKAGENLTPIDIVESVAGFAVWLQKSYTSPKVIIGRDGRVSGELVSSFVSTTLISMGVDVVNLDLSTTPTVEVAVLNENADAGIVITASHNPMEWNALKFLNNKGEFISADDGEQIIRHIESGDITFAKIDKLGSYKEDNTYMEKHIEMILDLPIVDVELIKKQNFTVALDTINSTGSRILPQLLTELNCNISMINDKITGKFAHNPEPLPENLEDLAKLTLAEGADLGICVDPDVDRLAFVSEDGSIFGEEYTLVAIADFILSKQKGNTVSNLSSTRALRDLTEKHGGSYYASAVGEVNVVNKMKEKDAVIGGEGNGGVIYPEFHYGRDAVLGVVLFLNLLAEREIHASELKFSYSQYYMSKKKINLTPSLDVDKLLLEIKSRYESKEIDTQDGVKIYFEEPRKEWVHLRKSNTEPIIRVYTESNSIDNAEELADRFIEEVNEII